MRGAWHMRLILFDRYQDSEQRHKPR